MKTFNKILIGAGVLAAVSLTACQDALTTSSPSAFDDKNVFAQYELAEFNIFSIYEVFGHTNAHRGRYLPWYGFNTDTEIYLHNGEKFDDKSGIAQYEMRLLLEGALVLYEDGASTLLRLAMKNEQIDNLQKALENTTEALASAQESVKAAQLLQARAEQKLELLENKSDEPEEKKGFLRRWFG